MSIAAALAITAAAQAQAASGCSTGDPQRLDQQQGRFGEGLLANGHQPDGLNAPVVCLQSHDLVSLARDELELAGDPACIVRQRGQAR